MIEREEVRSIVQEVLEEEHLHNFTKIFEKEHNLFRGTHDKMAVPPAVVENYYTQKVVDSMTHWERDGDNIYYNDGRVGIRTSTPTHLVQIDGTGLDDNAGSLLVAGGTQQFIQVDSASRARFICDAHDADASIEFQEDDVIKWTAGFDFTDNLKFKISEGVPGANTRLEIMAGGSMNVFDTGAGHIQIDAAGVARFMADSTSADSYTEYQDTNVLKWCSGYDFTDGSYAISEGAPGTNNRLKIASGGAVTIGGALTASGTVTIPTALTGVIRADSGVLSVSNALWYNSTDYNFIYGIDCGAALESGGTYNIFMGRDCGRQITTGDYNFAAGHECLYYGTTASQNTALGYRALYGTTGQNATSNVALGYEALKLCYGTGNFGLGVEAGESITSGSYNVCIGTSAGKGMTTTTESIAIGISAMAAGSGSYNVAIGAHSLSYCTGAYNSAVGRESGNLLAGGNYNCYFGRHSGYYNVTGSENSYFGYKAGFGATNQSHSNNVGVGAHSLFSITTGGDNTCLGYKAGYNINSGASNVCIGYMAGETNLTVENNQLWIANSNTATPLIWGDFGNAYLGFHGKVSIGSKVPSAYADLTLDGLGALCMKEITTPTADADYGKIYTKSDNKLYCQTGDGVEHEVAFV